MRADRLVAALLLLQSRGQVTAAVLARELEVSVATARRDLEALAAAGIPVYPRPGRGGGWSLVGGARTDLTGLSAAETRAVFLLLGPAAAASGDTRAAMRKLVRALPATFRADAEAAADATMVDPTGWGDRHRAQPATVQLLQDAVVHRRKVRLVYTSGSRRRTERLVDPWGMVDKDDVWYLVAGTPDGQRTFRVDRVLDAEATAEPADRPDRFALAEAWAQVVDEVEERRSRTWATVLVESRFVPVLRDQFGLHCRLVDAGDGDAGGGDAGGGDAGGDADDGDAGGGDWTRVQVAAPTPLDLARNLAGWGATIDVVEPESVRDELSRIGAELTSRYPGGLRAGTGRPPRP